MSGADIPDQLEKIFRGVFVDYALPLGRETSAKDVDGWDSLTHLRLIVSVQRGFGIKFSAAETGRLKNVGELIDLVASKVRAGGR